MGQETSPGLGTDQYGPMTRGHWEHIVVMEPLSVELHKGV